MVHVISGVGTVAHVPATKEISVRTTLSSLLGRPEMFSACNLSADSLRLLTCRADASPGRNILVAFGGVSLHIFKASRERAASQR